MKKVLIAAAYLNTNKKKLVELLAKNFTGKVEFTLDSFENFSLFIDEEGKLDGYFSGINIKSFDFVYIRSKTGFSNLAKTVAISLERNKVPYADKAIANASYIGDKLTSLCRLGPKVPTPSTFFAHNLNNAFSISTIKKLGFPLVIKDPQKQRMTGIFIINSEEELLNFTKTNDKNKFIFQKHIDIINEYRIFVIEGKAQTAHTRIKRNYSSGKMTQMAKDEWHEFVNIDSLPKKLIKVAENAAKELLLDIAGVDVCIDKSGQVYCIEVNRGPGIDYDDDKPEEINALIKFFKQKTS